MPWLDPHGSGNYCHGVAGAGAYYNNTQFDGGGSGGVVWYDDHTLVYQHVDKLYSYDIKTHAKTQIDTRGTNFTAGSGYGHWAAMLVPEVYSSESVGYSSSEASILTQGAEGLNRMGPDGSLLIKPVYQSNGPCSVRELDGNIYDFEPDIAYDPIIVAPGQILWHVGGVLKSYGFPTVQVRAGAKWRPRAIQIQGDWWISYWQDYGGDGTLTGTIVVHPIDVLEGYEIVGSGWYDISALSSDPNKIRIIWASNQGETAGSITVHDIKLDKDVRKDLSTAGIVVVEGRANTGTSGGGTTEAGAAGTITLSTKGDIGVVGMPEELVQPEPEAFPSYPMESGKGRIVHPLLGPFDYEVKPDEWVNIDADAVIPPMWSSTRTLTSAANVLWAGVLRDVTIIERWKPIGGLSMPITQLRMLIDIWTNPIDPEDGFVKWYPTYITQVGFRVLPVGLSVGSAGIQFDDVVNYLDEHGKNIGWVTETVTLQMRLVERL